MFGITDVFDYLTQHSEQGELFNSAMTDSSRLAAPAIAEAYDFGRFRRIVDAGGGHGMLLISILLRYPGPRGLVFDLPHVVNSTPGVIEAAGLSDPLRSHGRQPVRVGPCRCRRLHNAINHSRI